jgi:hypothetical protein
LERLPSSTAPPSTRCAPSHPIMAELAIFLCATMSVLMYTPHLVRSAPLRRCRRTPVPSLVTLPLPRQRSVRDARGREMRERLTGKEETNVGRGGFHLIWRPRARYYEGGCGSSHNDAWHWSVVSNFNSKTTKQQNSLITLPIPNSELQCIHPNKV